MKKISVLLLAFFIMIAMCACGNKSDTNNSSTAKPVDDSQNTTSASITKNELIYNSTEAFDYAEVEGGITIIYFKNYDKIKYDKIYVPSEIEGKKVVGIGELDTESRNFGAIFGECEVVLPDTVTYIGKGAFTGAAGLVKVSGGKNCDTIAEHAFMLCKNLTEITFIDNVSNIADNAFSGCEKYNSNN